MLLLFSCAVSLAAEGPALCVVFAPDGRPETGVQFRIWKVPDGSIAGFSAEDAEHLLQDAARTGQPPSASAFTDTDGRADFAGLAEGTYLVSGDAAEKDGVIRTPVPFLIYLTMPQTAVCKWTSGASPSSPDPVPTAQTPNPSPPEPRESPSAFGTRPAADPPPQTMSPAPSSTSSDASASATDDTTDLFLFTAGIILCAVCACLLIVRKIRSAR